MTEVGMAGWSGEKYGCGKTAEWRRQRQGRRESSGFSFYSFRSLPSYVNTCRSLLSYLVVFYTWRYLLVQESLDRTPVMSSVVNKDLWGKAKDSRFKAQDKAKDLSLKDKAFGSKAQDKDKDRNL